MGKVEMMLWAIPWDEGQASLGRGLTKMEDESELVK